MKNSNFNNRGSRLKALENNTFDFDVLKSNPIREDQIWKYWRSPTPKIFFPMALTWSRPSIGGEVWDDGGYDSFSSLEVENNSMETLIHKGIFIRFLNWA